MRRLLFWIGLLLTIVGGVIGSTYWWWFHAPYSLTPNIVYGQRDDKPLVMEDAMEFYFQLALRMTGNQR